MKPDVKTAVMKATELIGVSCALWISHFAEKRTRRSVNAVACVYAGMFLHSGMLVVLLCDVSYWNRFYLIKTIEYCMYRTGSG